MGTHMNLKVSLLIETLAAIWDATRVPLPWFLDDFDILYLLEGC